MKLYFHADRAKALKEGDVITKEIYRGESIFASLMPYADDNFLKHIDKLCRNGISTHGAHYLIRPAFEQIIVKDCGS